MIDIDEIEEICDVMIDGGFQYCPPAGCGSAEKVKELITRLRETEKDAARYRWLREARDFDSPQHQVFCKSYGFLLDSDIDEAMQCK